MSVVTDEKYRRLRAHVIRVEKRCECCGSVIESCAVSVGAYVSGSWNAPTSGYQSWHVTHPPNFETLLGTDQRELLRILDRGK